MLSKSRIQFRPTTGAPWVRTLTLPTGKKGKANPAKEGLLVGDEYYIRR